MMSIAQRNAETVAQNQSEASMNVDMKDVNVTVVPPDMLILVSMNKLREMENELKAARDFIFEIRKLDYLPLVAKALKEYDKMRQE